MTTVLLVEDDEMIRNMYTRGLAAEGFSVTPVGIAGEALLCVEQQHFDIILLDMLLGGMSGLDFLESASLQVKAPDTKVIGFSNIGSDTVRERARVLGVADFLNKVDYDPPKLAAYLKNLMQPAPAPGQQPPAAAA